jgi:hypothetical protein
MPVWQGSQGTVAPAGATPPGITTGAPGIIAGRGRRLRIDGGGEGRGVGVLGAAVMGTADRGGEQQRGHRRGMGTTPATTVMPPPPTKGMPHPLPRDLDSV